MVVPELARPPPSMMAVLPLTVQLVSVIVPLKSRRPPPEAPLAELPLTVQLVNVVVPPMLNRPPPSEDNTHCAAGGVIADCGVGQRGSAPAVEQAATDRAKRRKAGVAADGAVGQLDRARHRSTGRRRLRRYCR